MFNFFFLNDIFMVFVVFFFGLLWEGVFLFFKLWENIRYIISYLIRSVVIRLIYMCWMFFGLGWVLGFGKLRIKVSIVKLEGWWRNGIVEMLGIK